VVCGLCGKKAIVTGQDYLACSSARTGACTNQTSTRRGPLEAHALDLLARTLMPPDVVEAFITAFTAEWNRHAAETGTQTATLRRDLREVDRKIQNLVNALSEDGPRSPNILSALEALETRQAALTEALTTGTQPPPALPPNLATLYRTRVAALQQSLAKARNPETLEAARALIEKVAIYPRQNPDDPPQIDLEGNLLEMLKAANTTEKPRSNDNKPHPALATFIRSVKDEPRAEPPPCLPCMPFASIPLAPPARRG
jgi:hypothetical protein